MTRANGKLFLPVLFIFWGVWQLHRISLPLIDLDPKVVHDMMKERRCNFKVDLEESFDEDLLVEDTGWYFMLDKYVRVIREIRDPENLLDWLTAQIVTLNFIEEVLFCDKFVVATIVLAALNIVIYALTAESLIPNVPKEPPQSLQPFNFRQLAEKFVVLTSVVVRTPDSLLREKHFNLNHLNSPVRFVMTDITIFALWYVYLASISTAVKRLTDRLEEAVQPGKHSFSQWESGPCVKVAFLLFSVFCTSVSTVSFTISSLRLIHPLYASIFLVESIDLLLKCCYGVALFSHSFFHREAKNTEGQRCIRLISASVEHLLSIIRYCLYIYVGGFVNNKVIPLCFIMPTVYHLNGLFETIRN